MKPSDSPIILSSRCAECDAELDIARPTGVRELVCNVCAAERSHRLAAKLVGGISGDRPR